MFPFEELKSGNELEYDRHTRFLDMQSSAANMNLTEVPLKVEERSQIRAPILFFG